MCIVNTRPFFTTNVPLFDTHIVVDWSARSTRSPTNPTKDAIWWAVVREGVVQTKYHRTRHAAIECLTELCQAELSGGRRVLAGFDFPFGYPAGVAAHLTGTRSAFTLWDWLSARICDSDNNANNRFTVAAEVNRTYPGVGPFWGRPSNWTSPDIPPCASERTCRAAHPPEKRLADQYAAGAKTVWQLFYSGSVGSQTLVGLPALNRLRSTPSLAGCVSIWPFDSGLRVPDRPLVLAEVYPSLLKDAVAAHSHENEILDRAQVRVSAGAFASLDAEDTLEGIFGGAAGLTGHQRCVVEAEEAWILGLGHEKALNDAVATPLLGS